MATHSKVITVVEDIPNGGCGCCQGGGFPCGYASFAWNGQQWELIDDLLCMGTPVWPSRPGAFVGEHLIIACICEDIP